MHDARETAMEVKGEVLLSIPMFILKKFGKKGYEQWVNTLTPHALKVYKNPIDKNDWFPLESTLVEPSFAMCDMFFNKSLQGAWECGRYSAEYGLKGIYKILAKLSSPQVLIKKAGPILLNYYRPSKIEITESDSSRLVMRITEFPEMHKIVEYRIAGWAERAIEICGGRNVTVNIRQSLANHDPYTEYVIRWKKNL